MELFGTNPNNNGEAQFYSQLFQTFDTQKFGTVQGGQVFGFFLSSGLNKAALGDIWDEATQKQSGGLNVAKFANAMRLISLAQRGIAPKLQNIAPNSPVPVAKMQYPSHLQMPNMNQASQSQQPVVQSQQAQKPAEPDPFGGLTSGLGFDLGSANNANGNDKASGPSGPTWEADPTGGVGANGNAANDLLGAGGVGGVGGVSTGASMDVNNYDTNTVISHNSTFDSPKFNANPNNPNSSNDNLSLTPGGPLTNGNNSANTSMINEYAPTSHMKQMSHAPTLVVDHGVGGLGVGAGLGPAGGGYGGHSGHVAPPGLNRRISTKILHQEERLREQIRQAEQREKLAKKQANTQRIENERLERENEQLKLEINSARQAQADALKQSQEAITSVQPLRVENEKLKQAINQWKELIQTKDEELEQLEQEVDSLRLENEKLENSLTADKSKVDDFQFKLERSEALLQELKTKNRDYELQINEIRSEKITLEDEKRNLDLQIVQIKDEMKKLKRNGNSGLGISDRNTLKQKEASLFDINNIGLNVSPSPSKPVSASSTTATTSNMNSLNNGMQDLVIDNDDKPESDDDDTGIVPPGSHDFNFDISSNNDNNGGINEYGPGAAISKPPQSNDDDDGDDDDYDDNEPDMIDKEIEEKIEIEEDVIQTILIDDEYRASDWYMSASDVKTYHKYFLQADANQDGLIDGGEANKFFTKSKLNRKLLAKIWVLADQNKKGKLTEPMFCSMFHLVMKIKKSGGKLQVPTELPKCLTLPVVEKLGTNIQKTVKQKKWITQKKTIKVANPNKKKNKKSKKSKKKKTPPPLPVDDGNNNKGNDALSFGDDWGADFGNTDWGSTDNKQTNTTTTSDTINTSQQETKPKPGSTQNDDNWNAFGAFFGDQ
eukprot:CAMPEP_0201591954 /NCGR_PEP_ID=MMETSP0190_2-20130828/189977_1 /ASSEMBLY_ACC=CAM_ASM_000263 /TAXON_ID=37353 /ORGANISM="Rosalina sp." /LENGTH=889 /DNA_ID=CAMNT_0048050499 /DNA_START=34 /DNA_END=2706 /DNA_ORIENTATION=+